jgi:hypothetical protein
MSASLNITVLAPSDLQTIDIQDAQAGVRPSHARIALARKVMDAGPCFAVRSVASGQIVMCAGLIRNHKHYGTLWSLLSPRAGLYMVALTRKVQMFVARRDERRIDTLVHAAHEEGIRWAQLLGFELEGQMPGAAEDGGALLMFVKRNN